MHKKELLTKTTISIFFSVVFLYLFFAVVFLNYNLFFSLLSQSAFLQYKIQVLFTLFMGIWTSQSVFDASVTFVTAVLVGINAALLYKTTLQTLHDKSIKLSVGGASVLGIVSTGCSSCGFSVLSLLGLTSGIIAMPLIGIFRILSLFLLVLSAIIMIRQLTIKQTCLVQEKKKK